MYRHILQWDVWIHKTTITLPLFIEVPVPRQESELLSPCVARGINVASVSAILLLYFGTFLTCEIVCFPFYYAIWITISYVTTIPILHDCYLDVSAVSLLPWYELSTGVAPDWCWKKFLSFWTILASSSPLIINNTYELVKCRIKINDMRYNYK